MGGDIRKAPMHFRGALTDTGATSASGARTALGVEIGTNVQAYDAALQSIAGQTTVANQILYTTATDAYATTALTPLARDLLGDATAAAMKTRLGLAAVASSGSADDLTTGKLADARLPTIMSGKTFLGGLAVSNTPLAHGYITLAAGNATNTGYVDLRKGDGNRAGYIGFAPNSGGSITLNAEAGFGYDFDTGARPTWCGIGLMALNGGTFTGDIVAPGIRANAGDLYVSGDGNKHLWFQTSAGVNRAIVYHDVSPDNFLAFNLYNASGVYQRGLLLRESGYGQWAGHVFDIGTGNGSAAYHLKAGASMAYRLYGDSFGGLYIQRSTDNWASANQNMAFWDATGNVNFPASVSASSFSTTANGNGNNIRVGDDAWIGDINQANTVAVRGQNNFNAGWIRFGAMANGFGVDAGSPDIIRYAGWSLQTDGNQYMPWAGLFLHQIFEQKAGIYAGSNRDETNFPIGHTILVETGNGDIKERNSAHAIYLSSSYGYAFGGAGAQLAGTWRARGGYDSPGSGAWTYCFVRTA